jgi:hypothetical protein
MTREDIICMAQEAGFNVGTAPQIENFAKLLIQHERKKCIDLLMSLHKAQSNNGNHNYYHFAANAIKELRS